MMTAQLRNNSSAQQHVYSTCDLRVFAKTRFKTTYSIVKYNNIFKVRVRTHC